MRRAKVWDIMSRTLARAIVPNRLCQAKLHHNCTAFQIFSTDFFQISYLHTFNHVANPCN